MADELKPEGRERVRVESLLWAQLGELCGVRTSDPQRLEEFLALMDCIREYHQVDALALYQEGYTQGASLQAALMADNESRGVIRAYGAMCAELDIALPAWVIALAADIETRRQQLLLQQRARQASVRPGLGVSVH